MSCESWYFEVSKGALLCQMSGNLRIKMGKNHAEASNLLT